FRQSSWSDTAGVAECRRRDVDDRVTDRKAQRLTRQVVSRSRGRRDYQASASGDRRLDEGSVVTVARGNPEHSTPRMVSERLVQEREQATTGHLGYAVTERQPGSLEGHQLGVRVSCPAGPSKRQ